MKNLHYFEAICSAIVVGLGQIIKGESKKGLLLLLTFYFVVPAAVYISLIISGYLFITVMGFAVVLGVVLWGYSVGDALLKHEEVI